MNALRVKLYWFTWFCLAFFEWKSKVRTTTREMGASISKFVGTHICKVVGTAATAVITVIAEIILWKMISWNKAVLAKIKVILNDHTACILSLCIIKM